MDIDRVQRQDIDNITDDRLTLAIDPSNLSKHFYEHSKVDDFEGSNWYFINNSYVKYNLIENDSLVLWYKPIGNLVQKDIKNIIIVFDYESENYSIMAKLDNISLIHSSTTYENVNFIINGNGHIDITCGIFGIDNEVLNTIISEQGFGIGLNFKGNRSNANIKLSNIKLQFEFENKLQEEILAVSNRITTTFDFYVENEDLVIDFLGEGQGGSSGGGGNIDIDMVNQLIHTALDNLGLDMSIDLLDNGSAVFDVRLNKGD